MTFLAGGKLWLLLLVPVLIAVYVVLQRRRRAYTTGGLSPTVFPVGVAPPADRMITGRPSACT